jgi:hypothetical protein
MNNNSYEKPKDWGVAPQTNWVSGTPIGQDNIRMPQLGDPGAHENVSERVSFGDDKDGGGADTPSLWQGKMVKQCPAGTSSQGGVCMPDPKSKAKPESRQEVLNKQFDRDAVKDEKKDKGPDSFKRELPKPPPTDPQIRRIAKMGYKGRNA